MSKPRVLIADDHEATRIGMREALEAGDCEVVAEAATAYAAVDLARRVQPDACLLDIAMPGSGLWALREILAHSPDIRCVMLTISDSSADLLEALASGAWGYLLKGVSPSTLPQAIRAALEGDAMLSGRFTGRAMEAMRGQHENLNQVVNVSGRTVTLTNREVEVLELLVTGASTEEIAAQLTISQVTVRRHIADARHKLQVSTRAEALALIRRERRPRRGPAQS